VLDVTVAIGLVWLASIGNIPRRWRLATIWVMPAVALASLVIKSYFTAT
jgi:glucan phosphoethanolaminetransferase (alkaline phosphatase superfamily)